MKHGWKRLSDIKKSYIAYHLSRRKDRVLNDWLHYEALFKDITDGYSLNEAAKKHHIARTQVYQVLQSLHIAPPPPLTHTHKIIRRKMKNFHGIPTDIPLLDGCSCRTCQWLRLRIEKVRAGNPYIRLDTTRMSNQ